MGINLGDIVSSVAKPFQSGPLAFTPIGVGVKAANAVGKAANPHKSQQQQAPQQFQQYAPYMDPTGFGAIQSQAGMYGMPGMPGTGFGMPGMPGMPGQNPYMQQPQSPYMNGAGQMGYGNWGSGGGGQPMMNPYGGYSQGSYGGGYGGPSYPQMAGGRWVQGGYPQPPQPTRTPAQTGYTPQLDMGWAAQMATGGGGGWY